MTEGTRTGDRIKNAALREKVCFAPEAAALIKKGYRVGMSGFTGSGYPKLVPQALAEHILRQHSHGDRFRISVMTGASTSSELDGALAMVDGIELRMPYRRAACPRPSCPCSPGWATWPTRCSTASWTRPSST